MSDVEYTPVEVARHNNAKDLWVTIHGHAYDLTKFLKEHPGGEEVLLNVAGQDGTACFDEVGHSQEALQLRDALRVGRVTGDASSVAGQISGTTQNDDDDWEYEEPKKESSPMLPVFIALGVAVYGVLFYYFFL